MIEERNVVWSRRAFFGICAGYTVHALYLSRAQFLVWHASETGKYLVPPYRGIGYFMRYAFMHFWLSYILSFIVAMLFFWGAQWLNKKRAGMLFEPEEPYFLATGLFVSGHPAWIFYLCVVFAAYLIASLIATVAHGATARLSFYYFWLPCAAVTIFINAYLAQYAWYANLSI